MEVKKSSGEKRGGVKFGGLGGGGLLVIVGGALVAATMWSFNEFRKSRNPSCKMKLKKVDDVDQRQAEEKDRSASNLPLDVEKRSKLGTIEEEIQECMKIEDVSINETMVVVDAEPLSSVSEDELLLSQDDETMELIQFASPESVIDDRITFEKKGDELVQFMTLKKAYDDGSNDAISEDCSERDSRGTTDSSSVSDTESPWPVEPSEVLTHAMEYEKKLNSIQTEIIEVEENVTEIITSTNGNDNVSIQQKGYGSTSKDQTMARRNTAKVRIWVSTILVALLVLLSALLAQQKQISTTLVDSVSSINGFITK